MKRLPLIAFAACLMTAAAQAQPPVAAPQTVNEATAPAAPAESPAVDAKAAPDATAKKPRLSDANCLRETGSRIPRRDDKPRCNSLPGRAYSKDDIDRTGYTNLGDALRALDPAVR